MTTDSPERVSDELTRYDYDQPRTNGSYYLVEDVDPTIAKLREQLAEARELLEKANFCVANSIARPADAVYDEIAAWLAAHPSEPKGDAK